MIQNMAKYIDAESDYFFIKGQEKEQFKFVAFLLHEGNRTFEQIADIAGVAVDFVKSVSHQLAIK